MSRRLGLRVETCVYPWSVRRNSETVMLLGRQRSDLNAGLWVPLGTQVDEVSFPLEIAARDLTQRGLAIDRLRPAGLVTEIGQNGWQTHLLLFTSEQRDIPEIKPDEFAEEYDWVTPDNARSLKRPRSDAAFDYHFLTEPGFYYAEFRFDSDERASRLTSALYR